MSRTADRSTWHSMIRFADCMRVVAVLAVAHVMVDAAPLQAQPYDRPRLGVPREGKSLGLLVPEIGPYADLEATRRLAESGDWRAQQYIGAAFAVGQRLPRDLDQAIYWLRSAANHPLRDESFDWYTLGCALIQRNIGIDAASGIAALRKSDIEGYPIAMIELSKAYRFGIGVPQDDGEAWHLVALAAAPISEFYYPEYTDSPWHPDTAETMKKFLMSDMCVGKDKHAARELDDFLLVKTPPPGVTSP
ncbi:MAG: tetratricopeptide repeat protein [Burkholderiales bacterium]